MFSFLVEFKIEFSFLNKLLDFVLRYLEYFYVLLVGKQEIVFLCFVYSSGEFVKKSFLILIREQFMKLLDIKKVDLKRQQDYEQVVLVMVFNVGLLN